MIDPQWIFLEDKMSGDVRKPDFCIYENKEADQLCCNWEDDQHLCFCYLDSTLPIFLNPKFHDPNYLMLLYSLVCVGPGWKL